MRFPLPQRLLGKGASATWFNRMREQAQQSQPLTSGNMLVTQTTRGTIHRPRVNPARPGATDKWQGEWHVRTSYATGDIVRVSAGQGAGLYRATQNSVMVEVQNGIFETTPAQFPWRGEYWVQWAKLDGAVWT